MVGECSAACACSDDDHIKMIIVRHRNTSQGSAHYFGIEIKGILAPEMPVAITIVEKTMAAGKTHQISRTESITYLHMSMRSPTGFVGKLIQMRIRTGKCSASCSGGAVWRR